MDEFVWFHRRRVLITGHTGFKGSWLSLWLLSLGARVSGYSLNVPTAPSLVEALGLAEHLRHHSGDVRDAERLACVVRQERPEVIFHLAAQPLVRRSYAQPKETFDVNVGGTVNVLEAVRRAAGVRAVICVTTDKCYDNRGWAWGYRENDPLGGRDPYSASKAGAELAAAAYRESFFAAESGAAVGVGLATVRAGNVIGGGDWAAERIVPDCVRALADGEPVTVRNPRAVRPWQHVLEPLAAYLLLAARLGTGPGDYAGAWNFGPPTSSCRPVADVVREVIRFWGSGTWEAPDRQRWAGPHEADCLRLCSDKALTLLPWRPCWTFHTAVRRTVEWYRAYYQGGTAQELRDLCLRQIKQYRARRARSRPAPTELLGAHDAACVS
jgi:CDP-glucose 4,6-dehydratase